MASRGITKTTLVGLLILLLGLMGIAGSKDSLRSTQSGLASKMAEQPPLYLPDLKYVKLVTLGFNNFISDLLWFNTINYFGKQYANERDYRWLAHMCDLVTSLDTQAYHAYQFCGVLLAWEAKDLEKSNLILTRAIKHQPNRWRHYYLRGFNYWYFLEENELAKRDMLAGSRIDGAPEFLAGIASRLLADKDGIRTAISFLKDAIKNSKDKRAKKALIDKLKRGYLSRDIQVLQRLAEKYNDTQAVPLKELKDLVAAGLLKRVPKEPFKGKYYYDAADGKIKTTSGEKGLSFRGKTAKTGIMSHEFN